MIGQTHGERPYAWLGAPAHGGQDVAEYLARLSEVLDAGGPVQRERYLAAEQAAGRLVRDHPATMRGHRADVVIVDEIAGWAP
jgi:hypothetical protein